MKLIEAVIQQFKLQEVCRALEEMGIEDFMESAVVCHGRHKGQTIMFRGATFVTTIFDRVKLEIEAADESVANIIEAIGAIARTGQGRLPDRHSPLS